MQHCWNVINLPVSWLVTWSAPSHYLIQCWDIANWTPKNKLDEQTMNKQWNYYRNSYIFIQENPLENVVWKMASILSRPQCVNYPTWGIWVCTYAKAQQNTMIMWHDDLPLAMPLYITFTNSVLFGLNKNTMLHTCCMLSNFSIQRNINILRMDWIWEVNDVDGVHQLTKDALYNTLASRASYGVSYESIL